MTQVKESMADTKWCRDCDQHLPASAFSRRTQSRDGMNTYCRECVKARRRDHYVRTRDEQIKKSREWVARNPERKRVRDKEYKARTREQQRVRTWEKENPEAVEAMIWRRTFRSRCAAYGLEPVVEMFRRSDVAERQGSESCAICEATDDLVLDHVRPIAAGGTHTLENVRLLCAPCNGWKVAEIDRPLIEAARAKARRAELSTAA